MIFYRGNSQDIVLGNLDPKPSGWFSRKTVGLGPQEQEYHTTVWGKTGKGKSTLLHNVIVQQILQGKTIGLIDPHHDLARDVLQTLISKGFFRHKDAYKKLAYIDWGNGYYTPYNFLKGTQTPTTKAADAYEAMKRVWPELEAAPLFRRLFENALLVLIANDLPITYLQRLLVRDDFRRRCMEKVQAITALDTFHEFDAYRKSDQGDKAASTLNRVHALTFHELARWTFGQPDNSLDFRTWMDEGTSFIMDLGHVNVVEVRDLLGAMLMTHIERAAMSRSDIEMKGRRRPLTLFVDEWPTFAGQSRKSISTMLSQARKYGLRVWLAAQSTSQIEDGRLSGALENCANQINFGLGYDSAEVQSRHLAAIDPMKVKEPGKTDTQHAQYFPLVEQFGAWTATLQNLPLGTFYVKIDDAEPIRARTILPTKTRVDSLELKKVLRTFRDMYQRSEVEVRRLVEDPMREAVESSEVPAYTKIFTK